MFLLPNKKKSKYKWSSIIFVVEILIYLLNSIKIIMQEKKIINKYSKHVKNENK